MRDQEWNREFSRRLRCKMNERLIKQKALCELTDISQPSMSKYMKGFQVPNSYELHKIARALECSTDELINFDESDYYY